MKKIEDAIDTLETMYPKKCKMVDGILTDGYDDYESEKGQVITLAIRSLKAWKEIIEELESKRSDGQEFWTIRYDKLIGFIMLKLEQIEE